jgi:hypothetical protein
MKSPSNPGKPPPPFSRSRFTGPHALGALMPAVTRPAFQKQSPAAAQVMADWPLIVGPALAAATEPRKLSGGTLTLGCSGPVALELQHLSATLIERINAHLGRSLVQRLRFIQVAAPARDPAPPRRPPPRPPVAIEGLPDGPLRDALAALGAVLPTDRA